MPTTEELAKTADWSKREESTCTCSRCDATYRSKAKIFYDQAGFPGVSEKPCPGCGEHCVRAIRGDPEGFSV